MSVWFNGRLVPENKVRIDLFDRGFMYGDGIFESLRTYNGKPFMLDEHLKRLYKAAKLLSIKVPNLSTAVLKTLKSNNFKESYIKMILTRGVAASHGLDTKNVISKPTIAIIVKEQKDRPLRPYTAIITRVRRGDTLANAKTLNYANNVLAKIEAVRKGADEAIMLTREGYLAEGTVSNIFFVKGGVLYTPSLKTGILEGITRGIVIKLARKLKIKVMEDLSKKERLYAADECFITFSGRGIVPILKIDKRLVGNGKPGKITKRLIEAYDKKTRTAGSLTKYTN